MDSLVSIIVPVYNVEKYLKECVNSLLKQTYSNIEIILVDDESTDKSGKLCDYFATKYNKIRAFHKKNSGLGLTRNYGEQRAHGKYVMFVDSDDYVDQNMVLYLMKYLYNNQKSIKIDTVIGGFTKVDNNHSTLFESKYSLKNYIGSDVKNKLLPRMLGSLPNKHDSIEPSVCNRLFLKDIIINNNLKFVSERKLISEDIVWDTDYFNFSQHVIVTPSVLYYYRYNNNSLTTRYMKNRFDNCVYFYKYMLDKTKKLKILDLSKNRLKKQFFINLRECFSQEKNNNFFIAYTNIKNMCTNSNVQKIIRSYPINQLGLKQKSFVNLIKYRQGLILTILAKGNVI